jgi:hypothetical protein
MEIILILLILFLLVPPLFALIILPLLFLIFVLIPGHFLLQSIVTLINAPRSLLQIATSTSMRRNHALEHATVNVLEKRYGEKNIAGFAEKDGFKLTSNLNMSPEAVFQAGQEALKRLQQGEKDLAIHKSCGTSYLVTNVIFSVLFLGLLFYFRYFNILAIIAALVMAQVVGRSLGVFAQRWFTTRTDVQNLYIDDFGMEVQSANPFMAMVLPRRYFFKTAGYASYRKKKSDPKHRLPHPDSKA